MAQGNFFTTPTGKKITGMAYGLGASVVIIGALFKIMHFPGAGPMLMIGMGTEAILFAISAFEPAHREYKWDILFPQLNNEEGGATGPMPGLAVSNAPASKAGNSIDDIAAAGKLAQSDVQKLNEGIKRLSETASQIADVTAAVSASSNYAKTMTAATEAISSFAATQTNLKASSDQLFASYKTVAESMSSVATDAKGYMTEMQGMTKNLSAINAGYEMQVQSIKKQAEMLEDVNSNFTDMQTALKSAASETLKLKDEASKLSEKVSSLNTVYGNMLNAFGRA